MCYQYLSILHDGLICEHLTWLIDGVNTDNQQHKQPNSE